MLIAAVMDMNMQGLSGGTQINKHYLAAAESLYFLKSQISIILQYESDEEIQIPSK